MFNISTHICNEMKETEISIRKLDLDAREELLKTISEKYIDAGKKGAWFWEKFIKYEYLQDDMAWNYIMDFVGENECIMLFNQDEEKEMFVLQTGRDLNYVLSETYGFEFYITDRNGTYMICFNHHNVLYGCGDAEVWVKSKKNS